MGERQKHTFQFSATEIAQTAAREAEYHEARLAHWRGRFESSLLRVRESIGARVVEHEVTGGKTIGIEIDYGDPEAWQTVKLAEAKIEIHRAAAQRYRSDHRVYATQFDRAYELDTEDVHHFRLGDLERED